MSNPNAPKNPTYYAAVQQKGLEVASLRVCGYSIDMTLQFTLPKWYDLHAHFRQGEVLRQYIAAHISMGCAGILAMPNTKPPVGKVFKADSLPYWSIEEYKEMILAAGGNALKSIIIPMYLTKDTTPEMIESGAKAGILQACKYYPPHGTTGAEHSTDFTYFMNNGVFSAMQERGIVLCVHGEEHGMRAEDYFTSNSNAESYFYRERMPKLVEKFSKLKIVAEHITTKTATDFVLQAGKNVAASVTPQHLIYTVGHLVQGLKYHLYCMPLVKFEQDRIALQQAVINPKNTQFFAGTDSAPHAVKATECGCAAGCFTGGVAPQLYAEAFELAGIDLSTSQAQEVFERFLCRNGADFYGLSTPTETFTLIKQPSIVKKLGDVVPLPLGMSTTGEATISWSIK